MDPLYVLFYKGLQDYRAGCLFAATSYYRTESKTMPVDYVNVFHFHFIFSFFFSLSFSVLIKKPILQLILNPQNVSAFSGAYLFLVPQLLENLRRSTTEECRGNESPSLQFTAEAKLPRNFLVSFLAFRGSVRYARPIGNQVRPTRRGSGIPNYAITGDFFLSTWNSFVDIKAWIGVWIYCLSCSVPHHIAMPAKQFYLLGEAVSSAKNIDFDPTSGLEDLKHLIAAHFAVVEPNGRLKA